MERSEVNVPWLQLVGAAIGGGWMWWASRDRKARLNLNEATPRVEWGPCCFCGLTIDETETDPCSITVVTHAEKQQFWFCHAACFRGRLTDIPEAPGLFEPAHF
jgi:hypothetical protein